MSTLQISRLGEAIKVVLRYLFVNRSIWKLLELTFFGELELQSRTGRLWLRFTREGENSTF